MTLPYALIICCVRCRDYGCTSLDGLLGYCKEWVWWQDRMPSILQQMALLIDPVLSMRQGQEVLIVVGGAMKMVMPTRAAGAHLTGCHRPHQVGGDTKYADWYICVTNQHHKFLPGSHPLQILVEEHVWDQKNRELAGEIWMNGVYQENLSCL